MPATTHINVGLQCVLQFITVFLGSFIAGSVLNQARALISNPTSILSTLGTAAPLTSIFFLTFIELNVRHKAYFSWHKCGSCCDLHISFTGGARSCACQALQVRVADGMRNLWRASASLVCVVLLYSTEMQTESVQFSSAGLLAWQHSNAVSSCKNACAGSHNYV